jgi:UDPglucose 6-dehydrogenase
MTADADNRQSRDDEDAPIAWPPKVGIIGLGVVGLAARDLFEGHCVNVTAWDRMEDLPYPTDELAECDFCVICVDTPTVDSGADLSSVCEAVERVPCSRLLVKSTMPPGSTEMLERLTGRDICFWPEYIGESAYHNPHFSARISDVPFVVIGGRPPVRRWFIDRLIPILGPTKRYFQCSSLDAELIKYTENAFFAVKITFVNEMRRLAEAFGGDWHTVREGWLLDPRVEPMHTAAFAHSPGFAGRCLPKDLQALAAAAAGTSYTAPFLRDVLAANARFRAQFDAVDVPGAA